MRKSKAIALSLLGLGTAGLAGCGSGKPTEPDRPDPTPAQPASTTPTDSTEPEQVSFEPGDTWYDAKGKVITPEWTKEPGGTTVPVVFPHDRLGRPWEYDEEGKLVPPPPIDLPATPIIGGFVYVHSVPGLRSAGLATVSRGGLGRTGGYIMVPG